MRFFLRFLAVMPLIFVFFLVCLVAAIVGTTGWLLDHLCGLLIERCQDAADAMTDRATR